MADQTIRVTQREDSTLELSASPVNLAPGATITWEFPNISPDHLPFIVFHGASGDADTARSSLGPFHALAPSARKVVGVGNSGRAGLYAYTALVLGLEGPVATSDAPPPQINNLSNVADISPAAHIVYHPGSPPRVTATPNEQKVTRGGIVVWSVEDLPDAAFVTLDFTTSSNPFPDPLKGPFLAISTSRGPGSSLVVTGVGLLSPFPERANDPISYLISVRNAQGDVLASSPDPVIEPVGSPPTGR